MNEFENGNENLTNAEGRTSEQPAPVNAENSATFTQNVSGNDGEVCKRCLYSTQDGTPSGSDYCVRCANNVETKKDEAAANDNVAENSQTTQNQHAQYTSQFSGGNPYSKTAEFNSNGKGTATPFEGVGNAHASATPFVDNGKGNAVPYGNGSTEGRVTAFPENASGGGNGFAISSLVLGILSIVCCCLPSNPILMIVYIALPVLALVFGIISVKKHKNGLAIAGIVTGAVGLFFGLLFFIFGVTNTSNKILEWLEKFEESLESELGSTDSSSDTGVIDAIKMFFRK